MTSVTPLNSIHLMFRITSFVIVTLDSSTGLIIVP